MTTYRRRPSIAPTCSAGRRRISRSPHGCTRRSGSSVSSATTSVMKTSSDSLARGPRAVVVKRGEYGSVLFTQSFSFWSPAFPFDEVTDPTGAGDSFAGGFLGHLAESGAVDDRALRRATLHGTVCASFAVERVSVEGIEASTPDDVATRYRLLQDLVKV